MTKLSITTAWNESSEYLKHNFGALFTIAVALVVVPTLAMQVLGQGAAPAGEMPAPGLWMLFLPVVLVLNIAGSLAISSLALGRQKLVGEAIAHGFRRCLPMIGAAVILLVGLCIVVVPLALLSGITAEDIPAISPAKAGRFLLVLFIGLIILLYFAVRLLPVTPVAANEPVGPLAILARSWRLTAGHFWKLLGFIILVGIVAMVVMLVVTTIFGLLLGLAAGPPDPGTVSALLLLLVTGLVNAAFAVVMATLIARIYLQLAGDAKSVAKVFE